MHLEQLVLPPQVQRKLVLDTTTADGYFNLHKQLFVPFSAKIICQEIELTGVLNKDFPQFWRKATIIAIAAARYGFESCGGIIIRHNARQLERSPFSLPHSVALLSYLSDINLQAQPYKTKWIKDLEETNPVASLGINCVSLYVENGRVQIPENPEVEDLIELAEDRVNSGRPICMPDTELDSVFSRMGLSSFQADSITQGEFMRNYFPRFKEATRGLIDPDNLLKEYSSSFLPGF